MPFEVFADRGKTGDWLAKLDSNSAAFLSTSIDRTAVTYTLAGVDAGWRTATIVVR
jgi:hypothetical protein